jgi:hypothetical protein
VVFSEFFFQLPVDHYSAGGENHVHMPNSRMSVGGKSQKPQNPHSALVWKRAEDDCHPPPQKKKQKIGERATGAPVTNDSEGTSTSSSDSASSSGSESNDEGDAPADPGGQSDDGNRFFNVICITFFNNVLNNIVKRHQMRFLISMAGRGASPI